MTKIKKIILLMIIMLGAIIVPQYSVRADSIGWSDLKTRTDLYCVNHDNRINETEDGKYLEWYEVNSVKCNGYNKYSEKYYKQPNSTAPSNQTSVLCKSSYVHDQATRNGGTHYLGVTGYKYKILDEKNEVKTTYNSAGTITINPDCTLQNARTATMGNKTITSDNAARIAYILAHGNGYRGGTSVSYSPAQQALYKWFWSFTTELGSGFGSNDASFVMTDSSIYNGAKAYVTQLNNYKGEASFNDNTGTTDFCPTIENYIHPDNKQNIKYFKIGPITWDFSGNTLENDFNISVTKADGSTITSGIKAIDNQNNIGTCGITIKKNSPFYLLIPLEGEKNPIDINDVINLNKIKITLRPKQSGITVYSAKIELLKPSKAYKQKLIKKLTTSSKAIKYNDITFEYNLKKAQVDISKRDVYDNTGVENVQFILQHKDTGLYVSKDQSGTIKYVTSRDQATKFNTGSNGNILITGLVSGKYIFEEVAISNSSYNNSNLGRKAIVTAKIKENNTNTEDKEIAKNIRDKEQEFKITGKVWTPKKEGKDEKSVNDNAANTYDTNKLLVQNIRVELWQMRQLKEKTETIDGIKVLTGTYWEDINKNPTTGEVIGQCVGSTKTGANGNYSFKILARYKDELTGYKVKFVYDGIDFIACATPNYNDKQNGSKALENATQRIELNNKYATITGKNNSLTQGEAIHAKGKDSGIVSLSYSYNNKVSTINGLSAGYNKDESNKRVTVKGDAKNAIEATYKLEKGIGNEVVKYLTGNTVEGINLALITRESPDLSVSNQIENVVTTVNGYNNLYKKTIDKRGDGTLNLQPSDSALKVGVTYVEADKLSNLTVYPSDVKTLVDDTVSDKLQIFVTYKVRITNESTSLYNRVKELAIYYDNNYELRFIGNVLDESKYNYVAKDNYRKRLITNSNYSNYSPSEYKKVCINMSQDVIPFNGEPGKNNFKEIYMTFKVSDTEVMNMLEYEQKGEIYTPTMNNIVEINAYSTYSDAQGTAYYAGVDKNSAAGNVNVTNVSQIDNDTGVAREFTINQKEERTLTGTVFLDSTSNELQTGAERKGDSIYKESEDKTLEGVQVTLIGQTINSKNIVTGQLATSVAHNYGNIKTNENGNYTISGFIPGDYTLQYQYDNKTTYKNGEDTVNINTVDYKSAIVYDVEGQTKVKTAFKNGATDWYKLDNPQNAGQVRTQFTRYSEAVDNWETRKGIDENYKNVDRKNTGRENTQNVETAMTATTPRMEVAVELNTISGGNTYTPANYKLLNMDFGITERPRQQMEIEKEVSTVKVALTNDQVLLDAVIIDTEEGRKLQNKASSIKVLPGTDNPKSRGIVDIELDNELIHGATLEIGYTMKAKNTSELDYTNEAYYKYGDKDENSIVKITPSILVDYVSNDLTYDSTNEINIANNWKLVNLDNIKDVIDKGGVLYTDIKGNDIKKENINTLLQSNYWADKEVALAPDESDGNLKLVLTKLLSNTDTDMTYDNDVELIGASKTGGRTIVTKIGEYTFDGGKGIGGSSEEVTITPPTGSTENTMIYYVIISVATIALIVGGIAFISIKRKK